MAAFMNTAACGAVVGVSMSCDIPGLIYGMVLHAPSGVAPAGQGVVSTSWRSKAFSSGLQHTSNEHDPSRLTFNQVCRVYYVAITLRRLLSPTDITAANIS